MSCCTTKIKPDDSMLRRPKQVWRVASSQHFRQSPNKIPTAMWNSFLSSTDAAKERLVSVLEKTGEALHQKATAHVRHTKGDQPELNPDATHPEPSKPDIQQGGDDTNLPPPTKSSNSFFANPSAGVGTYIKALRIDNDTSDKVLDTLKVGWGSVVKVVESTQKVVEKEIASLQAAALMQKGSFRITDTALPLDVQSLLDVELTYITSRIITLAHPFLQSSTNGDVTPQRKLAAVGHFLDKRHKNRYMVWNLTELDYDTSVMDDQVMTFRFPGMPSPPLGMLIKILLSMESWLKADEQNVIVVHCLTGRGRTCTVVAALLCWIAEAGFGSSSDPGSTQSDGIKEALEYIAQCKRSSIDLLTIPSQRRYLYNYFGNMLDGIRPSSSALILKRVIFSEVPKFGRKPSGGDSNDADVKEDENAPWGCSPYVQVFKGEQLLCTAASAAHSAIGKDELSFCSSTDGPISFTLDIVLKGDFLLRNRHLTPRGQRISMFRAAICTGYIPNNNMLRLTKEQLDGACSDKRFGDNFFVDLVFEHCQDNPEERQYTTSPESFDNESVLVASLLEQSISSSATMTHLYDSMVQKDSRFWESIHERRQSIGKAPNDTTNKADLSGPTIGKRRDFSKDNKEPKTEGSTPTPAATSKKSEVVRKRNDLEAFTIGAGLDFIDSPIISSSVVENVVVPVSAKKDDLMDALNAIDEDDADVTQEQYIEDVPQSSVQKELDANENYEKSSWTSSDADEAILVQVSKQTEDEVDVMGSTSDEFSIPVSSSTNHLDDDDDCNFDDDDFAELEDLEQFLKNAH